MKGLVLPANQAVSLPYTNSGSALLSGAVVRVGALWGVLQKDCANGETVEAIVRGRVRLAKTTGTAYTVGQAVAWDTANSKTYTTMNEPGILRITEAAASGDTECVGDLNPQVRRVNVNRTVTAGEASAEGGTFDCGFTPGIWTVTLLTNTGALNGTGFTQTISGTTITWAATAVATTDVLRISASEW